jgi:RND family efflux transporter MFP subunit
VPVVAVQTVDTEQPPLEVTGWGTVQPRDTVDLVPRVGGEVVAISSNLRAGGFFAAGEVLVRIETADHALAVEQARSQVAQAEVALVMAREEAAAARRDWQRTGGDALTEPGPLVFREPQLRQAEAQLAAARATLVRSELDLARCEIAAPFAGKVLAATVSAGQVVRAGEVLASIHDTAVAEITVHVPDRELAWIRVPRAPDDPLPGTTARVRADFAGQQHVWPGRAVRLGGAVDQTTRQVPVVVEVAAPFRGEGGRMPLLSGMFVGVTFASEPPPGSVTIPRRALRPDDVVWLLDGEDRLRIVPVEVARTDLLTAVVVAGLAPGDRLITGSLQYVSEGMQLSPAPADGGPADAPPPGGERP